MVCAEPPCTSSTGDAAPPPPAERKLLLPRPLLASRWGPVDALLPPCVVELLSCPAVPLGIEAFALL